MLIVFKLLVIVSFVILCYSSIKLFFLEYLYFITTEKQYDKLLTNVILSGITLIITSLFLIVIQLLQRS